MPQSSVPLNLDPPVGHSPTPAPPTFSSATVCTPTRGVPLPVGKG
jgi:hypothetical protein